MSQIGWSEGHELVVHTHAVPLQDGWLPPQVAHDEPQCSAMVQALHPVPSS